MTMNILLVDDSTAIRKILLRTLSQAALPIAQVYEANDGLEALSILDSTRIDLVLSDVNMPNMDGLELLTKIKSKASWKHLPVILITTEGNQAKVLEAVRLGANGYVRKPFTGEQIKEKVLTCMKEVVQ